MVGQSWQHGVTTGAGCNEDDMFLLIYDDLLFRMKTTTWLVSRGSTVLLRVAGCNEDDMFLLIYDDLLFIMKINLNSFKLLIVVISGGSLFHNFADLPIQLSSYLVINSWRSGIGDKFDFTLNIEESLPK